MSTPHTLRADLAAHGASSGWHATGTATARGAGVDDSAGPSRSDDPFAKALERSRERARSEEARQRSRITQPGPGATPAPRAAAEPALPPAAPPAPAAPAVPPTQAQSEADSAVPDDGRARPATARSPADAMAAASTPPATKTTPAPAPAPASKAPAQPGDASQPGTAAQRGSSATAAKPWPGSVEGEAPEPVVCGPAQFSESDARVPSTEPPLDPEALSQAAAQAQTLSQVPLPGTSAAAAAAAHAAAGRGAQRARVQADALEASATAATPSGAAGWRGASLGDGPAGAGLGAPAGLPPGGRTADGPWPGLPGTSAGETARAGAAGPAGALPGAEPASAAASQSAAAGLALGLSNLPGQAEPGSRALDGDGVSAAAAAAGAALAAAGGPAGAGAANAGTTAPAQATLPAHPRSTDFPQQLGAQLALWVRQGVQQARLHLNPGDMGPVRVDIQLDGAAAQVQLGALHADTRQALQDALPALAASLREAGFTLSGGGVDSGPSQRQAQGDDGGRARNDGAGTGVPGQAANALAQAAGAGPALRRRGLVDLVA